jgi:uncharacterized protein YvpB
MKKLLYDGMKMIGIVLLFLVITTACASTEETQSASFENLMDGLVREQVVLTLEAMAKEIRENPETGIDDQAPGESYSVEVTQLPDEAAGSMEKKPDESALPGQPIPNSHYIWNIWGHRQYFPIGCEASAADDWAKYFGVEVNEFKFQVVLPISDNPDFGFVGDVNGPWGQVPPYAYGVHAAPIAEVLRNHYGMPAADKIDFTIDALKAEIASGQPVIAWVIGNCTWSAPYDFIDKEGNSVVVAPYEHVVIVTGYDADSIRYMSNGKFYDIPTEYFERSWAVLGNMVVFYAD